jgi:hypothetical protein
MKELLAINELPLSREALKILLRLQVSVVPEERYLVQVLQEHLRRIGASQDEVERTGMLNLADEEDLVERMLLDDPDEAPGLAKVRSLRKRAPDKALEYLAETLLANLANTSV